MSRCSLRKHLLIFFLNNFWYIHKLFIDSHKSWISQGANFRSKAKKPYQNITGEFRKSLCSLCLVLVPIGRITIPREVIIFFRRKEYLLRTFYYIKHFQKKEGLGSQYSYIRWDQIATGLNCSEQTDRKSVV